MAHSKLKPADIAVEEAFVLESLRRLKTAEVRYIFTQMVDILSEGLAAQPKERKAK